MYHSIPESTYNTTYVMTSLSFFDFNNSLEVFKLYQNQISQPCSSEYHLECPGPQCAQQDRNPPRLRLSGWIQWIDALVKRNKLTKHYMFTIEPACYSCGNKELGSIGVLSSIRHGKQADFRMLVLKVFIWWYFRCHIFGNVGIELHTIKLLSVDRFATGAVSFCEITPLKHELRDDAVKTRSLVTVTILTGS